MMVMSPEHVGETSGLQLLFLGGRKDNSHVHVALAGSGNGSQTSYLHQSLQEHSGGVFSPIL